MKSPVELGLAAQISILAIILLGMLGGSLIVAYSGFGTSSKHGGPSVFVPAPLAYLLAAPMYGMSVIGVIALLRAQRRSHFVVCVGIALYVCAAIALTLGLRSL